MELTSFVDPVVAAVELAGVTIIVVGLALSMALFARDAVGRNGIDRGYRRVRRHVARSILLGLEVLVAGDIIRTVAVDPTLSSVGVLAGIVVIRTFLSVTLQVEATGRWPWQEDTDEPPVPQVPGGSSASTG